MNLSTQEEFKEQFKATFENDSYSLISEFEDYSNNPIGLELVENNDKFNHDSYGNENSQLERIFKYKDIYVRFTGTRCSYNGEEWNTYQFVQPKQVTKTIYETI